MSERTDTHADVVNADTSQAAAQQTSAIAAPREKQVESSAMSSFPFPRDEDWRPPVLGEFPHVPHYDIRRAAPSYANLAAVQAGFALAAVVLIASTLGQNAHLSQATFYRDWATAAFLIAFFGSVLSALLLSVIAGDEILSPRTNMTALYAAAAMSVSTNMVLWGLVEIMKIYLDTTVLFIAQVTFIIFCLVQPLYLSFAAPDNTILFPTKSKRKWTPATQMLGPTRGEIGLATAPGYLPLVLAVIIKLAMAVGWSPFGLGADPTHSEILLAVTAGLTLLTLVISSLLALVASDSKHTYNLPAWKSGIWIVLPMVVLALLIIAL